MSHLQMKSEKGEINLTLVGLIAAIVIAIAAFMYAHDSGQRLASQQATIDKLQSMVTSQEELVNKTSSDLAELQSSLQAHDLRLQTVEHDVQMLKTKPAPKPVAKPVAKKPAAKPATKHTTSTTHKKK